MKKEDKMLEAPKEQRLRRASLISEIYTEGNTYSQILRKPRFSTVSAMSLAESRKSVDVKNGGGSDGSDDEKKSGSGGTHLSLPLFCNSALKGFRPSLSTFESQLLEGVSDEEQDSECRARPSAQPQRRARRQARRGNPGDPETATVPDLLRIE